MLSRAYWNITTKVFVIKQHKIQIYKAPKLIYSLLFCVLYSGMIIIKQIDCLPRWHIILLFKCQIEVNWMHVLAVRAWRKNLIKHNKHVTLCTGCCNHLSTIIIKETRQVLVTSGNFFLLLYLSYLTIFEKIHLEV